MPPRATNSRRATNYNVTDSPVVLGGPKSSVKISNPRSAQTTSRKIRILVPVAQLLVMVCIVLYTWAFITYMAPMRQQIREKMSSWWGHANIEMDERNWKLTMMTELEFGTPKYAAFFWALPMLLTVVLVELLDDPRYSQYAKNRMLVLRSVMHRKPRLCGRTSWWSIGEWLFLTTCIGGNILFFYFAWMQRMEVLQVTGYPLNNARKLKAIAHAVGLNCVFCLGFLFLPATRNGSWMSFLGISYANGIKYHRWLGVGVVLTAFLHTLFYYIPFIQEGSWMKRCLPCFNCPLEDYTGLYAWTNIFGQTALLLFLIIGATSIPYVRRKFYTVFYNAHQLFIPAIFFLELHWAGSIFLLLPSLVLYMLSRASSKVASQTPVEVQDFRHCSDGVISLTITRSTLQDGDYDIGQFVYLNAPTISKREWHPFTIASSPKTSATSVTILLKSLGDWTTKLADLADECDRKSLSPTLYVDGYYGTSLSSYEMYSTVCLVGGGIGATPLFAILEDMVVAWTLAKQEGFQVAPRRVHFIFSFRELSLLEAIHPTLVRLQELDPSQKHCRFDFFWTQGSNGTDHEARLDQPIALMYPKDGEKDEERPMTKKGYQAQPFAVPLALGRSRAVLSVIFLITCSFSLLVLAYNNPISVSNNMDAPHRNLWPLERFLLSFLGLLFFLFIYGVVCFYNQYSRKSAFWLAKYASVQYNPAFESQDRPSYMVTSDVHTRRDLLAHYNVRRGYRPDTAKLLRTAYEEHIQRKSEEPVGVFMSGPMALKDVVDTTVGKIGGEHFDVHSEEFEL